MARYATMRGWVECDFADVAAIRLLIDGYRNRAADFALTEESADLYLRGWLFPNSPINWTSFVFYGASIALPGIDFVWAQVLDIAQQFEEVEGLFFVDEEEGARYICVVRDGSLSKESRLNDAYAEMFSRS